MADTMAGMMTQNPAMLQAAQDPTGGTPPNTNGAPQPTGMGGEDVNGSSTQAQFEAVVAPLVEYVQGEGRPSIVQSLGATPDIPRSAGSVISKMLLGQMQNAKQQANKRIPAVVLGQSALQLSNMLADISIEEGLAQQEQGDDIADESFYHSIADIGEQAPQELLTQEDRQVFAKMIKELTAAEQGRNGDSGGTGMNAGMGNGMGATNQSMAAMSAPGAPTEVASAMNAGMYDGNPNGGSLNG